MSGERPKGAVVDGPLKPVGGRSVSGAVVAAAAAIAAVRGMGREKQGGTKVGGRSMRNGSTSSSRTGGVGSAAVGGVGGAEKKGSL